MRSKANDGTESDSNEEGILRDEEKNIACRDEALKPCLLSSIEQTKISRPISRLEIGSDPDCAANEGQDSELRASLCDEIEPLTNASSLDVLKDEVLNKVSGSPRGSLPKDESIKEKSGDKRRGVPRKKRVLSLADIFVSLLVICPLVILTWRGIWTLMDLYHEIFPGWACFATGTGMHIVFAILKHHLHRKIAEELAVHSAVGRLGYRVLRIAYTWVFCCVCNMQWRGAWIYLSADYIQQNALNMWCLTCLLIGGLITLRCTRNLVAPPYVVVVDIRGSTFMFPTRYNLNTSDWSLYILDCVFSVGVVGTLVVFVWRGVWVLCDIYLFPENAEYSAVGSLVLGYAIVAVTFSIQPLMRYACSRLEGLSRLIAADVFILLSFVGTVNVWRGVWNVLDLWLLPEDPELSCWITHVGCFVFLVLLNCSNSVLVRGVYIDAEEDEGKCVVFPCHYLRLFFKIEREKKEARRRRDLGTCNATEYSGKDAENGLLLNTSVATILPGNPESLV